MRSSKSDINVCCNYHICKISIAIVLISIRSIYQKARLVIRNVRYPLYRRKDVRTRRWWGGGERCSFRGNNGSAVWGWGRRLFHCKGFFLLLFIWDCFGLLEFGGLRSSSSNFFVRQCRVVIAFKRYFTWDFCCAFGKCCKARFRRTSWSGRVRNLYRSFFINNVRYIGAVSLCILAYQELSSSMSIVGRSAAQFSFTFGLFR